MKKALLFLAAAVFIFAACGKNNGGNHGGGIGGDDEGDELIAIDGNFADWAAAPGVVTINRHNDWVGEVVSEDNQRIDAVKTMKVVADKYSIYVYLEVDMNVQYAGGVNWAGKDCAPDYSAHLDIYIDADNNPQTGSINWVFTDPGWEYGFEASSIFSRTAAEVGEMEGGTLFKFTGDAGQDIWAEDPPLKEDITGEGIAAGWGKLDGTTLKYELSITRSFMTLGNKIRIGCEVMTGEDWMLTGCLPQANTGTEGVWAGNLQEITLP